MTEKDLISQLKGLRQIKPNKDWISSTKRYILAEEAENTISVFQWKLAFAPVISVLMIIGVFGFAQNTVPGDFFFSLKKAAESVQVGFSPVSEKPTTNLKLANKRLDELTKIAENNKVGNLGQAIEEFQVQIAEVAKGLATIDALAPNSDQLVMKEILAETRKLEENKQKVESVLGTAVGDMGELENTLNSLEKRTAEYLINDLEARVLTENDQKFLQEAREFFGAGNYAGALERIWLLSNK